jgi:hypothetical protein
LGRRHYTQAITLYSGPASQLCKDRLPSPKHRFKK